MMTVNVETTSPMSFMQLDATRQSRWFRFHAGVSRSVILPAALHVRINHGAVMHCASLLLPFTPSMSASHCLRMNAFNFDDTTYLRVAFLKRFLRVRYGESILVSRWNSRVYFLINCTRDVQDTDFKSIRGKAWNWSEHGIALWNCWCRQPLPIETTL